MASSRSKSASDQPIRLAVGLATAGRRDILSETLAELARQTRQPDEVLVCPASDDDVDRAALAQGPAPARVVNGPRGLCAQRNRILEAADGADVIVFFDDDFFPCRDFLARLEEAFASHPEAVMITGQVLADGATGPGLSPQQARAIIAAAERAPAGTTLRRVHNGYGCNMAVRVPAARAAALRFDERLPLYGWLEDVDFSRRLVEASGGVVLQTGQCRGVHLGVKSGRIAGVRFGYSQIANPLHIYRKGVLSPLWTLNQVGKNLAANLVRSAAPEPWVDRRGRVKGNLLAIGDMLTGRIRPEKILDLA